MIVIALAIGFIIGLEREWAENKPVGVRSFALIAAFGGISAIMLSDTGGWPIAAGLLVLGAILDIFSAIVLVVPLILPVATQFGVHPVHLGVIFLANLELGYLTPPVGLNLFLAASRFNKPLTSLFRYVLPFLLIMALSVLLITYVPDLSLGILKLLGRV